MDTNELTLYCKQAFSDPLQLSAFQHMTDGFAKIFLKVVVDKLVWWNQKESYNQKFYS